jgi:hypothetical protein
MLSIDKPKITNPKHSIIKNIVFLRPMLLGFFFGLTSATGFTAIFVVANSQCDSSLTYKLSHSGLELELKKEACKPSVIESK